MNVDETVAPGQYPVTLEFSYQSSDLSKHSKLLGAYSQGVYKKRSTFWAVVQKDVPSDPDKKENNGLAIGLGIGGGIVGLAVVVIGRDMVLLNLLGIIAFVARKRGKRRVFPSKSWPFAEQK